MSQATVSVSWNADRFAPMTDTWFYDAEGNGEGRRVVFLPYRVCIYIRIEENKMVKIFLSSFFS